MSFNTQYDTNRGMSLVIVLTLILAGMYFSVFICKTAMAQDESIALIDASQYNSEGQQVINPQGKNISYHFTEHNGHFIYYPYEALEECYWVDDTTGETFGPFMADYVLNWIKDHNTIYTTGNMTLYYYSESSFLQVGGPSNQPALIHIMDEGNNHIIYGGSQKDRSILDALGFFWGLLSFDIVPFPFNLVPIIFSIIILLFIAYFI
jgi:hypothetical protein